MVINLVDFLKKYTAIPDKFIESHYEFYKMCEKNNFGIESQLVLDYLKLSSLDELNRRIRRSYEKNIDYIIKMEKNEKYKNSLVNIYYITFDCFENICLSSKTKKGNEVRCYMITLRKFMEYYKEEIANKIDNLSETGSYAYILVVNKGKNIFKVGVSKNMKKRLQAYSTGKEIHPDIKFIMAINDKKAVEKCVKSFGENSKYIIGKELYKIDYDLLKDLVFSCGKIDKKFSKNICKNSDSYVVFDDTKAKLYLDPYSKIINNKKNAKKNK